MNFGFRNADVELRIVDFRLTTNRKPLLGALFEIRQLFRFKESRTADFGDTIEQRETP
jgi:hypothetical protein